MRLKGKKVLITGSVNPRGIGFGIAKVFAGEGADIMLHYHSDSPEEAAASMTELKSYGNGVFSVRGDITDEGDVSRMIMTAADKMGGLDILVNNAGACVWEDIFHLSEPGLKLMAKVNLIGTALCTREAVLYMREHQVKGRIINISSCNARRPNPGMGGYGAMKAGMDLMTQSMALELAPLGITVNQVWPGYVVTDINKGQPGGMSEDTIKNALKTIPVGVMAKPEDIGTASLFFAEDKNCTVTGAVIKADGGAFIKCLQ